ncbi:MAG TPA: CDP-glucose 4,6-dehydratase, partial [Plantibacter sp.]|uniref:CDP-glucose 4,6-dehydratase n=1 Tax=Plantibacter sp. TaxID=1871045 RepID=UPI002CEA2E09|nr:CDP-glucose 4,6-dehydratase [Plantibacter sp.]
AVGEWRRAVEEVVRVNEAFWHGRRVFVTGHTGFKGSWLCLWLAWCGAKVVGYSDTIPTNPSLYEVAGVGDELSSIIGDVRDRDLLCRSLAEHRPEVVLHLAAQSLVRRSYAQPVLTYETNTIGTLNLLEAVRATDGVRAVVVVTTDKVYEHHEARRYREDDPLGGHDPYSSSKACAELVTASYRSAYLGGNSSPAVATVRAGNVIGGGDWAEDRLVPDLIAALRAGTEIELRYPGATRPWQHVLNPLDGYLVLAERLCSDRSAARAWNFGPDASDSRPVEWLVGEVAREWGSPLSVTSPAEAQPAEAPSLELDSSLAREALGWTPGWDLERGLRATVEWYRRLDEGEDGRTLTVAQIDAFAKDSRPAPVTA